VFAEAAAVCAGDLISHAGRDALCEKATGHARSVFPYILAGLYRGLRDAAKQEDKSEITKGSRDLYRFPGFLISLQATITSVVRWRTNVV
jgi:hypothetical protein